MIFSSLLIIPGASLIVIPILVLAALAILPLIFYLITLQQIFAAVKAENRLMEPGLVWLVFIPVFGVIWQIIIVTRLADSLQKEFADRNIDVGEPRPGLSIGLAYSILWTAGLIPGVGVLTAIAGFVCWIIYWVKIAGYKELLVS